MYLALLQLKANDTAFENAFDARNLINLVHYIKHCGIKPLVLHFNGINQLLSGLT